VLHELGHVLGYGHDDGGFMEDTLSLGTRWLPEDAFGELAEDSDETADLSQRDRRNTGLTDEAFASLALGR
jgi:hypothetical protein